MSANFLIAIFAVAFLVWMVAAVSMALALRHAQSGRRWDFMQRLSWFQFTAAEQLLSTNGIPHLYRMKKAMWAFMLIWCVMAVISLLLLFTRE